MKSLVRAIMNYWAKSKGEEFSRTDKQVFSKAKKLTCIETFELPDTTLYYWTVKIPLEE